MPARPIGSLAAAAAAAMLLAALIAVGGCSGYRQYNRTDTPQLLVGGTEEGSIVAVGKVIRLRTVSGAVVRGRVESLGPSELVVGGQAVPYSEIGSVQVRSLLWAPTVVALSTAAFVVRMITYNAGIFSPDSAK